MAANAVNMGVPATLIINPQKWGTRIPDGTIAEIFRQKKTV